VRNALLWADASRAELVADLGNLSCTSVGVGSWEVVARTDRWFSASDGSVSHGLSGHGGDLGQWLLLSSSEAGWWDDWHHLRQDLSRSSSGSLLLEWELGEGNWELANSLESNSDDAGGLLVVGTLSLEESLQMRK